MSKALDELAAALGISREYIRKAGILKRNVPGAAERLASGEATIEELWREYTHDYRVGVHIKMPAELRDAINAGAADAGWTRNDLLVAILRDVFDKYLYADGGEEE